MEIEVVSPDDAYEIRKRRIKADVNEALIKHRQTEFYPGQMTPEDFAEFVSALKAKGWKVVLDGRALVSKE